MVPQHGRKPAARWRYNRCNPHPTANLPLDGTIIAIIPIPLTQPSFNPIGPQTAEKLNFWDRRTDGCFYIYMLTKQKVTTDVHEPTKI